MKKFITYFTSAVACTLLFACAHPINMSPDLNAVQAKGSTPANQKVAFYISDTNKALEVTTPGGGGDKVRYFPYRDLEAGFYKALSEVFGSVSKIKEPKLNDEARNNGVSLLLVPELGTTSSSSSPFTWPPTVFGVNLGVTITDAANQLVKKVNVRGEGRAEFDEFKANFSLSAVRASNDALAKLIVALANTPELKGASGPAGAAAAQVDTPNASPAANAATGLVASLQGSYSGKYLCGPPLQGGTNNPQGFEVRASLSVSGNTATMTRKSATYSETVSGSLASDGASALYGQGAFNDSPDKPWTTHFEGQFSSAGSVTKFSGKGKHLTAKNVVSRECTVELIKTAS